MCVAVVELVMIGEDQGAGAALIETICSALAVRPILLGVRNLVISLTGVVMWLGVAVGGSVQQCWAAPSRQAGEMTPPQPHSLTPSLRK